MPRERGGRKGLVLEIDVGAIFDPKRPQNDSKSRPSQVSEAIWLSKVSSVRSFRPLRPVGFVSSRRLGRPGGLGPIVAAGYGLPAAG